MSVIKVTILGTTAGVPTRNRAHSSVFFCYEHRREFCCLFDCGEGTQRQIMKAGLNMLKINDIFISHWHGDHCLGIPGLIDTMGFEGRKEPVNIYSPENERAGRCTGFINHTMGAVGISPHLAPARGDGATLLLENDLFRIMSVPVRHSIPSVGFIFTEKEREVVDKNKAEAAGLPRQGRVYARLTAGETVNTTEGKVAFDDIKKKIPGRKVVYSGDTEACEELFALAEGADLLIHDCTYFEPPEEGKAYKHATFPEIREMVGRYGIKKTVLTHISRKKSSREQLDDYIKGDGRFVIARDLMTLEL